METLYNQLSAYNQKGAYPFHMPGHKRNTELVSMGNPIEIDITEIDDFDNLHNAKGTIKKAMERAARIYDSEETRFLINGSTVGLLAAILGCTKKGDTILVARNCHKAVYNAIYLNELKSVYVYPPVDGTYGINCGLKAENIQEMLITYPQCKCVVITSPTYEGILSEIDEIAQAVHKNNIPLIVDEAHGAHFGFIDEFPKSSVVQGADVVIHSVHKTLPAMTQTALIHLNGNYIDRAKIREYLSILQSSSPSYVLMASIDNAMDIIDTKGKALFKEYIENLNWFYKKSEVLNNLKVLKAADFKGKKDPSKIVIMVNGTQVTGHELYDILRLEYHLQLEMSSLSYVLAMTSIADTKYSLDRLLNALVDIDRKLVKEDRKLNTFHICAKIHMSAYEAIQKESKCVAIDNCKGLISKEYAYIYPPGIPILVPGEVITEEIINYLSLYKESGYSISGLESEKLEYIYVIKED